MGKDWKTIQVSADLKKRIEFLARMLKQKQISVLASILVPISDVIKQIEKRGYLSVNLKVVKHPLRYIVIIECYPSQAISLRGEKHE